MESIMLLVATYMATFVDSVISAESFVQFFKANPTARVDWRTGALYCANRPRQIAGPVDGRGLVALGELIADGHTASIRDAEAEFTPDHEIAGVEFIPPEYESGDGRYERASEDVASRRVTVRDWDSLNGSAPILYTSTEDSQAYEPTVDAYGLLDDAPEVLVGAHWERPDDDGPAEWVEPVYGSGRWAHVADAHVEEHDVMRRLAESECSGSDTWERRANATLTRERRVAGLMRYIWVHRADRRRIAALRRGVNKRYAASVRLIVEHGATEWELLYLSKAQRQAINDACSDPRLAGDYLPAAEPAAVEEIPPGGWDAVLAMALLTA